MWIHAALHFGAKAPLSGAEFKSNFNFFSEVCHLGSRSCGPNFEFCSRQRRFCVWYPHGTGLYQKWLRKKFTLDFLGGGGIWKQFFWGNLEEILLCKYLAPMGVLNFIYSTTQKFSDYPSTVNVANIELEPLWKLSSYPHCCPVLSAWKQSTYCFSDTALFIFRFCENLVIKTDIAQWNIKHCLGLPYWHYQLVLSWNLHQPESHQLTFKNVCHGVRDTRTQISDFR